MPDDLRELVGLWLSGVYKGSAATVAPALADEVNRLRERVKELEGDGVTVSASRMADLLRKEVQLDSQQTTETARLRGALASIAAHEDDARRRAGGLGPGTLAVDLIGIAKRALQGE